MASSSAGRGVASPKISTNAAYHNPKTSTDRGKRRNAKKNSKK